MTDGKSFSKRDAERKAAALRRSDEWNPQRVLENRESPLQQLQQESRKTKTAVEYDATISCESCQVQRKETGDDTALCEQHFAEMMAL